LHLHRFLHCLLFKFPFYPSTQTKKFVKILADASALFSSNNFRPSDPGLPKRLTPAANVKTLRHSHNLNPQRSNSREAPPNSRTYDIALHSVLTQHMKYGKRYSTQFKRDAVELLISGKSISELSLDLHVGVPTLWRWKKEYLRDLDGRLPKDSTPSAVQLEAENQRLRRENCQLQQNQDILKKALGILGLSRETLPPGMP